MTSRRPTPERIHHLYLLRGSGVSMGLPRPPPGRLSSALAGAPGCPLPACAVCTSRGNAPEPETEKPSAWVVLTFFATNVCALMSSLICVYGVDGSAAKVMLLGTMTTTLSAVPASLGANFAEPLY